MMHTLPRRDQHLVVYMPVDVPDGNSINVEPEAWICDSYEEAVTSIEEFMRGGDFIPEIDARIEIFDDMMKPCCDQRMIEDLIIELLADGDDSTMLLGEHAFSAEHKTIAISKELEKELEEEQRAATGVALREEVIILPDTSSTTASSTSVPTPGATVGESAKGEEKVAQFQDEIEIEDKRG